MTAAQPTSRPSEGPVPPDRAWLEQIFREHYAELCTFVHGYTASGDIAEDVVQELFLSIWKDPERWSGADGVRMLLFVAARNRALDHLRRQRVRDRHAQRTMAEGVIHTPPTADDELAHKEIQQAMDQAVASLPERARAIFRLSRDEGLTYREIAERLDLSIKTVETQMSRSLKKLRVRLATFLSILLLVLVR